jgi:hypothetical protein
MFGGDGGWGRGVLATVRGVRGTQAGKCERA